MMQLQTVKLVAYQLGEKIHIKNLRTAYCDVIFSFSNNDIFIYKGDFTYIYIQNSGEVAFSECNAETVAKFIEFVKPFIINPVSNEKEYKEDFIIEINQSQQLNFQYNTFQVPEINADVIKIAMLNVCQSVALDYFTELSQHFLFQTTKFTNELELRGKLSISNTKLMKFIGKTLNTQNRIIDNLYFIDAPDTVWDNEYLSHINNGLSHTFNLKTRFKEVEYTLKIIDSNLRTFSQLVQHRDSNKMELIIIFLILFEVINALIINMHK